MTPSKVLVVDDEPGVRTSLVRALGLEGFDVTGAADAGQALERLAERNHDVLVLDIGMPEVDGLELCRRLRRGGERAAILMLTARDAIDDRVAGLEAGADDYLVKPFALTELVARLRALLRRIEPGGEPVLRFGDLSLNRETLIVSRGSRRVDLSRTEFSLLEMFLEHPKQVLSRTQIFDRVWGYDFGPTSNALGVYIGYLRRKLEAENEPRLIQTVRGFGYALREAE